jgi:PAS domain S-box-containing protein
LLSSRIPVAGEEDPIAGAAGGDDSIVGEGDLEAKYRTLLEQIPAIVYVWSVGSGLERMSEEYVSPQIEAVLGFGPQEWAENPRLWIERLHPDDRDEVLDETARSVEAGEPFTLEYRMIARNGRVVWLHDVASIVAHDDRGNVTRYQGIQFDITARKEAEHARRRDHERVRLLDRQRQDLVQRLVSTQEDERRRISDGIHDDTLQSLFAVRTRLETIIREHPGSEHAVALAGVRDDISRLTERVRHLAFELHPRVLDAAALKDSLQFLIERSRQHGIEGRLDDRLAADPPPQVCLTAYRVAQEALRNAEHHGEASTVTISLEDRAGGVLIRIHDDGRGFDTDAPRGSGGEHLGLISMQERSEMLGGWLQVESEPGSGATVECWIPLPPAARVHPQVVVPGDHPQDPIQIPPSGSRGAPSTELTDLSPREREVAVLLSLGHTNTEISAILHLSVRTVEHHRSRVFRKLDVRSRAGLVQALRRETNRA